MSTFDEEAFERKLMNLKDTQESVSQLSHWCLVNKQHHKKIVTQWLAVLKKGRTSVQQSILSVGRVSV